MKDIFSEAKQNAIQKIVQEDTKLKKAREEEQIKKQQENLRRIEIESSTKNLLLALKPFFDELTSGGFEITSSSDWKDISEQDGDGWHWEYKGHITNIQFLFHEDELSVSIYVEIETNQPIEETNKRSLVFKKETTKTYKYKGKIIDHNDKEIYAGCMGMEFFSDKNSSDIILLLRKKILEALTRLEIQKNRT